MFVRQNKRFNIHAFLGGIWVDDEGTQHPGELLRDPIFREYHGITEIADPVRGDDATQYTQELDVAPWVIITDRSPEQIQERIKATLTTAIQQHLDASAQAKGYDNILSAVSYASYANQYQAEAISFLEWRSSVWTYAYQVVADVLLAARQIPTTEQLLSELPIRVGA